MNRFDTATSNAPTFRERAIDLRNRTLLTLARRVLLRVRHGIAAVTAGYFRERAC